MWRRRTSSTLVGVLLAWSGMGWNGPSVVEAQKPMAETKPAAPEPASPVGGCSSLFGKHADLWWNYCCQKRPEHNPVRNYHPLVRAKETLLPHHCHHGGDLGCCSECARLVGHPAFRHGGVAAHSAVYTNEPHSGHAFPPPPPVQVAPKERREQSGPNRPTYNTDFQPPVQLVPPREPVTLTPEANSPNPLAAPAPGAAPEDRKTPSSSPLPKRLPRNLIPPRFRPDEPQN